METLRLEEMERKAALSRGELIPADEARRLWAGELDDLIAGIEQFINDLPGKLGLGRDVEITIRGEWRAWRQRRAEQQAEAAKEWPRAA